MKINELDERMLKVFIANFFFSSAHVSGKLNQTFKIENFTLDWKLKSFSEKGFKFPLRYLSKRKILPKWKSKWK